MPVAPLFKLQLKNEKYNHGLHATRCFVGQVSPLGRCGLFASRVPSSARAAVSEAEIDTVA